MDAAQAQKLAMPAAPTPATLSVPKASVPGGGASPSGKSPSANSAASPGGKSQQLQLPDGATSRASSIAPSSPCAGSGLAQIGEDLEEFLTHLHLEHRLDEVLQWCESQDVKFLEELVEHIDTLVDHLKLDKSEALRATLAAQSALKKTHAATGNSPKRKSVEGPPLGVSTQSLRSLSTQIAPLEQTLTTSASERIVRAFSFAASIKKAQSRFRSLSGKLRSTEEEATLEEEEEEEDEEAMEVGAVHIASAAGLEGLAGLTTAAGTERCKSGGSRDNFGHCW